MRLWHNPRWTIRSWTQSLTTNMLFDTIPEFQYNLWQDPRLPMHCIRHCPRRPIRSLTQSTSASVVFDTVSISQYGRWHGPRRSLPRWHGPGSRHARPVVSGLSAGSRFRQRVTAAVGVWPSQARRQTAAGYRQPAPGSSRYRLLPSPPLPGGTHRPVSSCPFPPVKTFRGWWGSRGPKKTTPSLGQMISSVGWDGRRVMIIAGCLVSWDVIEVLM